MATLFQLAGIVLGEFHSSLVRVERSQEAEAFRKKYEHVFDSSDDAFALQSFDRFGELVPSRLANVKLSFSPGYFSNASLSSALSAAKFAAFDYATAECQLLLRTIASKCRVSRAVVSPWREAIEIKMSLQFVQKTELGTVPDSPRLRLDKIEFEYGGDDREKVSPDEFSRLKRKRSLIYSSMARDCAFVRRRYGNCSTYRIRISCDMFGSDNRPFVRVTGSSSQSFVRLGEDS